MFTKLKHNMSYAKAVLGMLHGSKTFSGPVQACLSMTNRCNLRCIHCYLYSQNVDIPNYNSVKKARQTMGVMPDAESLKQMMSLHADSDRLISCIDELLSMGTRRFQFGNTGEPFLHTNIIEIIEHLKKNGSYCIANSNGTLLHKDLVNELIRLKFDDLRITTMAGSADTYVATHPGTDKKTFENLTQILFFLQERKKQLRLKKPHLTLVFIIIRQNFDDIMKFAEFAIKVGANSVLFRPVEYFGDESLEKNLAMDHKQVLLSKKLLAESRKLLDLHGIAHNIERFYTAFSGSLATSKFYKKIPCYFGWLTSHIELDGHVYPCARSHISLGNIFQSSFKEIWNGPKYTAFRESAISMPRRGKVVSGCDCSHCTNYASNVRAYKLLHPVKGLSF